MIPALREKRSKHVSSDAAISKLVERRMSENPTRTYPTLFKREPEEVVNGTK